MANALKGEVTLENAGVAYTLVFDIDAICAAEDLVDLSFTEIVAVLQRKNKPPRVGLVRALLWAALRQAHPEFTVVEAGETFFGRGGVGVMPALLKVFEAIGKAFPSPAASKEAASGEEDPPKAEADGTGSGSSASGESST